MSHAGELVTLLARVGDGDAAALKSVYVTTSAKLFGVILRILSERGEAEDVLQEVYLTVWRKAAEFDATRASPVTWLATIARNRAIDRLRARASRPTSPLDEAAEIRDDTPSAHSLLEGSEAAKRVNAVLSELEPRHAAVIRAAYYEGLTYETLSAREGVPVGTLKSWVRRGLIRMRGSLDG